MYCLTVTVNLLGLALIDQIKIRIMSMKCHQEINYHNIPRKEYINSNLPFCDHWYNNQHIDNEIEL